MAKRRRTTRGLGWAHDRAKATLAPPDGLPCPYCGAAMYEWQRLDADHPLPRVLGGIGGPLRWSHASCNRRAGATLGNLLRGRVERRRWEDRWS